MTAKFDQLDVAFVCFLMLLAGLVGWGVHAMVTPPLPPIVYPARVIVYAPPKEMERTERLEELLMQFTRGHDAGMEYMHRAVTESMLRVSE